MFNGIIYNLGIIKSFKKSPRYVQGSLVIEITSNIKFKKTDIGESVCCDGVCLTLIRIKKNSFLFYLSKETIMRSNFKYIKKGKKINLEKSLKHGQKISGHYVQGHVDDTAKVTKINIIDKTWVIILQLKNKKLHKLLVEKASITINGVSLTISKITRSNFQINVIPHTLKLTNLKNLKIKDFVNVELDIFSKYISKLS
tara:strand:+ start:3296 stop:3892 length:597 start_codon:yes stop_codon:yes gene_type:complete